MTVHLMNRSSFTLLQSTIRITSLVKKAHDENDGYVALTDHNVMYGVPSFLHACKQYDVKPIIGLEIDCMYHDEIVPFLLLAKDNAGFRDLQSLSSIVNQDRAYCLVDELVQYSEHCFLIVYGEGGWFEGDLLKDKYETVRDKLQCMKNELPVFDIAISYQDSPLHFEKNKRLKGIAQSLKISTVAINKNYYLEEHEAAQLQVLKAIDQRTNIHDSACVVPNGRFYRNQEQMERLYEKDDLDRANQIAEMCHATGELKPTELPPYNPEEGFDETAYLKRLCFVGLQKRRNGKMDPVYTERLSYELDIITQMHFENYFLIVYDFIRYARKNHIYIGPGRGSAAGSLVAYCLGITMIDPIQYGLLFERFLNPQRVTMPDIDVDVPDNHRDEIIAYIKEKYGENHVGTMVTFGTLKARQCLRDVGKAMQLLPSQIEQLVKLLPNQTNITLRKALEDNKRLREFVQGNRDIEKVYQCAIQLEDLPRYTSVHPAGVILSNTDLHQILPLIKVDDNLITSQYTASYMQERGLIKMDILSLRNLTTISEIESQIREKDSDFAILNIPLDDPKTYQIFSRGMTRGIFQFESQGMQNLLQRMQPKSFADITACLALYRPSAMHHIQEYLNLRKHPEDVSYLNTELRPILQETFGIMIYQEQTMQVAQIAAGFSLAKADLLRQAISKKKIQDLRKLKTDFLQGCMNRGYEQTDAENLYAQIEEFAGYGFNKSHAVAYAYISYQTAYLKANYPYPFYISLLNSCISDTAKTSLYMDECRRRKVKMLSPSIHQSQDVYFYTDKGIQMPLSIIRGVGSHTAREIVLERQQNGVYPDFFAFVARMCLLNIKQEVIESLIHAGALDIFKLNRNTMLEGLEDAIRYGKLIQVKDNDTFKLDFELVSKPSLIAFKDDSLHKLEQEFDVLGFYLGASPLQELRQQYHIQEPSLITIQNMNGYVSSFGRIERTKEHRTKKGDLMMFVDVKDESSEISLLVFPKVYSKYQAVLQKGIYIRFRGKMSQDKSVICDEIQVIEI